MATVHHQSAAGSCEPKFIQPFPPECRVIVDDVDEHRLYPLVETENTNKPKTEATDSENSSSIENPMARIRRIQVSERRSQALERAEKAKKRRRRKEKDGIEAESRKIEFERLLEEHAQVIRRLKQMEETESSLHFSNTMANVSKA